MRLVQVKYVQSIVVINISEACHTFSEVSLNFMNVIFRQLVRKQTGEQYSNIGRTYAPKT